VKQRLAAFTLFLLSACPMLLVPTTPAAGDTQPRPAIHLASQTSWLAPDTDATIGVTLTGVDPASAVDIVTNVFPAVGSRSEFQRTLSDHIRGPQVRGGVFSTPFASLPVDPSGVSLFTLPLTEHPILTHTGVYPVRVELREKGGRVLDHFDTHFLFVTSAPESSKLGISLVLPFHAAPAYQSDGSVKLAASAVAQLGAYATSLADPARTAVPIVVHATPETVAALNASPHAPDHQVLAELATAVAPGRAQLVGGSWVPVDMSSLLDANLPTEVDAQLRLGTAAMRAGFPIDSGSSTWIADDWLNAATLSALADRGVTRVVIPEPNLAPVTGQVLTPSQPFQLEGRPGRRVAAVSADTGLTAHFTNSEPVLNAHQLLADLAVLYLDAPAQRRGVPVLAPRAWAPDPVFLSTVMQGLAASPLLAPMTLDDLFAIPGAVTSRRRPVVRTPAKSDPTEPASFPAATIRDTRRRLDSFRTLLPPTVAVGDDFERALLTGESDDLRSKQRTTQVTDVQKRIAEQLKLIRLPGNRSITMTARKGQVPLTIVNDAAFPVHVQLVLRSDKLKLAGGVQTMDLDLSRKITTVPITVEARTSGTFPLRISLLSPDGQVTLSTSRITIRSTAASGVGIILSVVAAVVVVSWWVRNIRHGRRERHLVPV
jgi:hypothetical protein